MSARANRRTPTVTPQDAACVSVRDLVAESGSLPWDAAAECVGRVAEAVAGRLDEGRLAPEVDAGSVLVAEDGTVRLADDASGPSLDPAADLEDLLDELLGPDEDSLPARYRPLLNAIEGLRPGAGAGLWRSVAAWADAAEEERDDEAGEEAVTAPLVPIAFGIVAAVAGTAWFLLG